MSMDIKNIIVELLLAGVDVGLACLGVGIAWQAKKVYLSYKSASSAFNKIHGARQVPISDLRAIISESSSADDIVILRGVVFPPPEQTHSRSWWRMSSRLPQPPLPPSNVLISSQSPGEKRAVVQIIKEICELEGGEKSLSSTLNKVPFVLVQSGPLQANSTSDYVTVNLDGSAHELPLTRVYDPILQHATNESLSDYPNIFLEELLPVGTEISAVGRVCTSSDGNPQIKAREDLPHFLTKATKAEMLVDLWATMALRFCVAVVLGSVAVGVLAYASRREWRQWKKWRKQRSRAQQLRSEAADQIHEVVVDDEGANGGNSDMQLCVICLNRRRTVVFVPCGHLICCGTCGLSVQEDSVPKCPMCREAIFGTLKVYF